MITCVFCNSKNIVRNGMRCCKTQRKQRYLCRACKRAFIMNQEFSKLKGTPHVVTLTMDLYFKGISLRKIQDHLDQFYNLRIHHETIRRWIKKYMKIMDVYVSKYKLFGSRIWHADEQMIKSKGKWVWLWNVLDAKSRFLIASSITERREMDDARKVFRKAKNSAIGSPEFIFTDGLKSYTKAIRRELPLRVYPKLITHINLASIGSRSNNNLIERYHSTFRERDKVMRGSADGIVCGYRLYYNFIRPHMGLDGHTPAEAAGINLNLEGNRWLSLIKKSSNINIGK